MYTYKHRVRLRVLLRVSLGTGWAQCAQCYTVLSAGFSTGLGSESGLGQAQAAERSASTHPTHLEDLSMAAT